MLMAIHFYLLFLLPYASSKKLTPEENAKLMKTCGAEYQKNVIPFKTFGGKKVKKFQYPWLASLSLGGFECSGALISPRHVLTAAHCVIARGDGMKSPEECARLNSSSVPKLHKGWSIFVGTRCTDPQLCKKWWFKPEKVYYHEDFNECTAYNDIAIFERSEDVPDSTATPICLPPKNLKISKLLKAAGAGFTGPDDEEPTHQPKGYQVIEALVMVKRRERRLVVMTPLGTGLCGRKPAYMSIAAAQGDSGGPLFQYNRESRITQIGITSTGNSCDWNYNFTSSDAKSLGRTGSHDHFTDIREYVDWICEKTGVCPPEIKEHHKGHKHKRKKDEHLLAILKVNVRNTPFKAKSL